MVLVDKNRLVHDYTLTQVQVGSRFLCARNRNVFFIGTHAVALKIVKIVITDGEPGRWSWCKAPSQFSNALKVSNKRKHALRKVGKKIQYICTYMQLSI